MQLDCCKKTMVRIMNNTEAISNIKKNKIGNILLEAAELLPASNRKIAIIGKQSFGKSAFINLISGEKVTDGGTIKYPTVVGSTTNCDLSSVSELLNDNNVQKLMKDSSFLWGIKGSEKKDSQNIETLAESASTDHFGFVRKTAGDAQDAIVKTAHILIAPDCPEIPENPSALNTVREIKNIVDVSDIVLLVGHPQDFMNTTFQFILSDPRHKDHKTIILVIIHDQKTNFFHFPFGDDKEADQIEKTKSDSASQTYDLLNRPTSSDALKQNLRESIVEDSRTLIEDIENLAKSRFKKFQVNSVFFFPTDEKESCHPIKEHAELVNRVHSVQKERIRKTVLDMSKSSSTVVSYTPYIAWQYFFRKAEDVCLDLLTSKILAYKRECVNTYAKLQFFEKNIAIQEKELSNILRDYTPTCPKVARQMLKKYFDDYCNAEKKFWSWGKDKAVEDTKKQLHNFLAERAEYFSIAKRIKNQLAIELPNCAKILDKALQTANGDFDKFVKSLESSFTIQTSIVKDQGPLVDEKNTLINKTQVELEKQKSGIINDFNYIIDIAKLLERADHVKMLSDKKTELENFSAKGIFIA